MRDIDVKFPSIKFSLYAAALLLLGACAARQPQNIANVCDIFEDRRNWHKAARESERRWKIPIAVSMAFVYQESSFRARARPERGKILWVIPGPRPSSAYGYAQVLDSTWNDYVQATGRRGADRHDFADAIDFIGWYNAMSSRVNNIAPGDARNLYLAYHEGNTGFAQGSYRDKPWLMDAALNVEQNAWKFAQQYESCRRDLNKNWFFRIFS
jgi:hypothetical protein